MKHHKLIKDLLEALESTIDYIDAIPEEAASKFPAMPGYSRDDMEVAIEAAKKFLSADQACQHRNLEESHQLAIKQKVGSVSRMEFSDWVSGQKAIADSTGLMFCIFTETNGAEVYYRFNGDQKSILPALSKGQCYVWVCEA